MQLPLYVKKTIQQLNANGFECYVVGGCVRDSLLDATPSDWDMCTNALPQAVMATFDDAQCIPTGLQHGTVTLIQEGHPLEITTYRTEGNYTDARHPDEVHFVSNLRKDLARRDFTINAMAYHPEEGIVDPFGGRRDLQSQLLQCVGVPAERFREDALRILRGLRFSSVLGFSLEEQTKRALINEAEGLVRVANERVREELDRLLLGKNVAAVLTEFSSVMAVVIPELQKTIGFVQHNQYHDKGVYEHTVAAVAQSAEKLTVRLALLLHDLGKPFTFSLDANGCGHFYSHTAVSEKLAVGVLKRLRYDNKTSERVQTLVRYHDVVLSNDPACVKRWLNRLGEDGFRELLQVKEADCRAQAALVSEPRLEELSQISLLLDRIVEEKSCFSLKDLAVSGKDVLALGIPAGKRVGEILNDLLGQVIEGTLPNDRECLLKVIEKTT